MTDHPPRPPRAAKPYPGSLAATELGKLAQFAKRRWCWIVVMGTGLTPTGKMPLPRDWLNTSGIIRRRRNRLLWVAAVLSPPLCMA